MGAEGDLELTDGRTVYAIGDVHGCAAELDALMLVIADDLDAQAAPRTPPPIIIFVGDYVDRGPDSKAVIERVRGLADAGYCEVRTLKGNHEEALLQFLQDPAVGPEWAAWGGAATLASYGVSAPRLRSDLEGWGRAQAEFAAALPVEHLRFLQELELITQVGGYAFVHAGVRPGVPLEAQSERDLLWIREDFLEYGRALPKIVVHGHTPTLEPELRPFRIGIDTGAFASGVLTAVRLKGEERKILQAGRDGQLSGSGRR